MKQDIFIIEYNRVIAERVYLMRFAGAHGFSAPGQFAQLALDGFYLRRPISVCDYDAGGFSVIYKVVGEGTASLARLPAGQSLDIITGLGNGFDISASARPLLVGGGAGVPPLYGLARALRAQGKPTRVAMGFGGEPDVFFEEEFRALGCAVDIATVNPGRYQEGLVTGLLSGVETSCDYYYACGPKPMLRAVWQAVPLPGQLSFESRMACGFGACMGCSCRTKYGYKRICRDGPVLQKEEIVW